MSSPTELLSIDIGSTYTKGIKIELDGDSCAVRTYAVSPTTVDDLSKGFVNVLATLTESPVSDLKTLTAGREIRFSSSAKGGLKIVAIGLVPDLTLKVARLTACSAGGKLLKTFSYRLTSADIREIESLNPDIVLLAGGSDGGNTVYPVENARKLAQSDLNSVIIYAGNRDLAEEVEEILSFKICEPAANVMPEIGNMNPDPARELIRKAFLEQIVSGKGLSEIVRAVGHNPKPTPLAMYELIQAMGDADPKNGIMLVDMGGATTDVYSYCDSFAGEIGVVLRGIREPKLKRSVEGDLGMRVSAKSVGDSAQEFCADELDKLGYDLEEFNEYLEKVTLNPDYLPTPGDEKYLDFDRLIARSCLQYSVTRHAGIFKPTHTLEGRVYVQNGKDIRGIKRIIGTGGYLSRASDEKLWKNLGPGRNTANEDISLWPKEFEYWIDRHYLYPLLANIVEDYPKQAVKLAGESLVKIAGLNTGTSATERLS